MTGEKTSNHLSITGLIACSYTLFSGLIKNCKRKSKEKGANGGNMRAGKIRERNSGASGRREEAMRSR
jgi:hypothetical protein